MDGHLRGHDHGHVTLNSDKTVRTWTPGGVHFEHSRGARPLIPACRVHDGVCVECARESRRMTQRPVRAHGSLKGLSGLGLGLLIMLALATSLRRPWLHLGDQSPGPTGGTAAHAPWPVPSTGRTSPDGNGSSAVEPPGHARAELAGEPRRVSSVRSPPPPWLPPLAPASSPAGPNVANGNPPVATTDAVAVCIVGQLRTFGMPAVHLSLLRVVQSWGAHAYFFVSTGFNARSMEQKKKPASACAHNATAVELFQPLIFRLWRAPVRCKNAGSAFKQAESTHQCFLAAQRYAFHHGFEYGYYVRLRPDLLFLSVPPRPVAPPSDNRTRVHRSHRDFAFYMTRAGLRAFREQMPSTLSQKGCSRRGSFEFGHPSLKPHGVSWPTQSGLVREAGYLEMWDDDKGRTDESALRGAARREGNAGGGLKDQVVHESAPGQEAHAEGGLAIVPTEVEVAHGRPERLRLQVKGQNRAVDADPMWQCNLIGAVKYKREWRKQQQHRRGRARLPERSP